MSCHMLFQNILQLWIGITHNILLPSELMFNKMLRKRIRDLQLVFSTMQVFYQKIEHVQEQFFGDLVFYIIKSYHTLSFLKNIWLNRLVLHQLGRVVLFIKQQFTSEINPNMVTKTMEHHILPFFDEATMVTTTFDLWMSCGEFNTFSLVVNCINKWEPFPITMGIFLTHLQ